MKLLGLKLLAQCPACRKPMELTWPMADRPFDPKGTASFSIDGGGKCVDCATRFVVRMHGEVGTQGQRWRMLAKTKGEVVR